MNLSMYQLFAVYYDRIFDFNPELFNPIFNRLYRHALDIGCGTGRLTKVIKDYHIDVLGIDLDSDMIEIAQSKFPTIDFKVKNMLDLEDLKTFDLITCFGNTLPHLKPKEFNQFFRSIETKLSNDGVFWIQLLNYDAILKQKKSELKPIIKEDFKFFRYYVFLDQKIEFHTRLETQECIKEGMTFLYPYQMNDFLKLKETHKLKVNCFGSLSEKPYDLEHDYYLYVKVQKRL
ncbi:MAG: class I SAM-dependent methyltransferase [Acholeplasmataceae bacterium]